MGKIDEVKEVLNSLRIGLSLIVGLIVIIVSDLVDRIETNQLGFIFWLGMSVTVFLCIAVGVILIKIAKRTRELRDL